MTNQQIIVIIVAALISSFANVIFEKILAPYIPERKKLNSYIKKFFSFALLYALPLTCIIWLMVRVTVVDKYFVLSIVMSFFSLAINISLIIIKVLDKQSDSMVYQVDLMKYQNNILSDTIKLVVAHTKQINKIEDELRSKKGSAAQKTNTAER